MFQHYLLALRKDRLVAVVWDLVWGLKVLAVWERPIASGLSRVGRSSICETGLPIVQA